MDRLQLDRFVRCAPVSLATLMPSTLETLYVLGTRGGGGRRRGCDGRRGSFKNHLLNLRTSLAFVVGGMVLVVLLVGLNTRWQWVVQGRMKGYVVVVVGAAVILERLL